MALWRAAQTDTWQFLLQHQVLHFEYFFNTLALEAVSVTEQPRWLQAE